MSLHSQHHTVRSQQEGRHYIHFCDPRSANSAAATIRRSPLLSEEPLLQRHYSRPQSAKITANCGSWANVRATLFWCSALVLIGVRLTRLPLFVAALSDFAAS